MIDVTEKELQIVKSILISFVPTAKVRVFGSRVNGTKRDISDLDLAIDCGQKMTLSEIGRIKEAFQESDLLFRVDVIDWNRTSEIFRNIISQNFEELVLE